MANPTTMTLRDVSEAMRDIDVCMMTTMSAAGSHESRPMSNNREVDWAGDSFFFAYDSSSAVRDVRAHASVNLAYVHQHRLLGKDTYISVEGHARVVQDKAEMSRHWRAQLNLWFPQGIDTPSLAMIAVKASRVTWWRGMENGEVAL